MHMVTYNALLHKASSVSQCMCNFYAVEVPTPYPFLFCTNLTHIFTINYFINMIIYFIIYVLSLVNTNPIGIKQTVQYYRVHQQYLHVSG